VGEVLEGPERDALLELFFGGTGGGPIEIGEKNPPADDGRGGTGSLGVVGEYTCCPLIPGDINGGPGFLEFPLFLQRLLMPLTDMIDAVRSDRALGDCASSDLMESAENRLDILGGGETWFSPSAPGVLLGAVPPTMILLPNGSGDRGKPGDVGEGAALLRSIGGWSRVS
jgi:hypothetical protein